MPICSYLVLSRPGRSQALAARLEARPECEVIQAQNADLLLLVTETEDLETDERLRAEIEAMGEVDALVLTFGEVDPDASLPDPPGAAGKRRPGLPYLGSLPISSEGLRPLKPPPPPHGG
jgi:nitrate reductase NapAB chaperone NapD